VLDIPYGPNPHQCLDLFVPDDPEGAPLVLFIHGGAWTGGNKSMYGFLGNFFARQGYVTVIANYRLTDNSPGRVTHPGHITDVARAFAWTYFNIADYGGDPEKIFISGHSAGGHLVSLLAVDPRYLKAQGLTPDYIAGVLSVSGVYDVRGVASVFGDAASRRDASPLFHVGDAQAPPMLLLYAQNDLPGLGGQALQFYYALLGVPSEALIFEFLGRDHGSILFRIGPGDEVAETMLWFMSKH